MYGKPMNSHLLRNGYKAHHEFLILIIFLALNKEYYIKITHSE